LLSAEAGGRGVLGPVSRSAVAAGLRARVVDDAPPQNTKKYCYGMHLYDIWKTPLVYTTPEIMALS